ncbi:MAG: hypothetical protein O6700_01200 [Gammaproteobacteria bacterium]|nr:hypothetical protein [Gammaproteobacteria bacterium]
MRIVRALSLVLIVSFLGPAFAENWMTYIDQSQFFSVNFPAEPDVREISYPSEYGAIFPAHVYTVQNGRNFYSVTVVDFTDGQQIYLELPDKTDEASAAGLWLYDQRASVAYAARNFRLRGGEVTYDAWHHIDLVEGHQLQITNPDQSRTYAGIYLHNSRLYILEATVPAEELPQGLFQQSLSFLDENGNRIRYQLKSDGSRTRLSRLPGESPTP